MRKLWSEYWMVIVLLVVLGSVVTMYILFGERYTYTTTCKECILKHTEIKGRWVMNKTEPKNTYAIIVPRPRRYIQEEIEICDKWRHYDCEKTGIRLNFNK